MAGRSLGNVDQLRVLAEVARAGSFSAAGRSLSLTQPGISKQVAALEHHFGMSLVERGRRSVRLTEAGDRVLALASQILGDIDQLELQVADLRSGEAGCLRLAASIAFGDYVLPTIVRRFRELKPKAEVVLNIGNTEVVYSGLADGSYDFGIASRPDIPGELVAEHLCPNPLLLFVAPHHPLLSAPRLTQRALDDFALALPLRATSAWRWRMQLLAMNEIRPRRWLEISHPEAIKRDVAASTDIGLLGLQCVSRELAAGELCQLSIPGVRFQSSFQLYRHKHRFVTKLMSDFQDYLHHELAAAPFWDE